MEQKKKDKDVLIVRDEKTGEISVVAGLDKDGSLRSLQSGTEHCQYDQECGTYFQDGNQYGQQFQGNCEDLRTR